MANDKKGKMLFRCVAYQEDDGSYTSVCLDLDIVEEGHLSIQEAMLSLDDAISSHMISAERLGFPKELTNRPAPIKYWKMLNELTSPKEEVSLSSFQFFVTQPKVFAPVAYV